jgi:hypothetical protein
MRERPMKAALIVEGTGPTGPRLIQGLIERGFDVSILPTGRHEVPLPDQVEHIHVDPHFIEPLTAAF